MQKVVFILSYANNQNALKRINEFQIRGIDIEVYGFMRYANSTNKANSVSHAKILGCYNNSLSYNKRIPILFKGIRSVIKNYSNEGVLYYLFGLDVASLFRLQCKSQYIYEEEDLIYTYIGHSLVVNLFKKIDKYIVNHSLLTVFTSEGFSRYHFGEYTPENIVLIPNKLKKDVLDYKPISKEFDISHIKIGFVGSFRFQSVYYFAKIFTQLFPNNEFHFFGGTSNIEDENLFKRLEPIPNCFFHGRFQNPQDLPNVYSQIDLLLSTYDVKYDNVKYAEPNKIYEAIYFNTPIIATKGTFLAEKIMGLGIGYEVDPLNKSSIEHFVKSLSERSYYEVVDKLKKLPRDYAIDNYDYFFEKLKIYTK